MFSPKNILEKISDVKSKLLSIAHEALLTSCPSSCPIAYIPLESTLPSYTDQLQVTQHSMPIHTMMRLQILLCPSGMFIPSLANHLLRFL